MTSETSVFNFTIILDGDVISDEMLDRLFEAGLDDGTFAVIDGTPIAEFDRAALTLKDAVASVVDDIECATPELRVLFVAAD